MPKTTRLSPLQKSLILRIAANPGINPWRIAGSDYMTAGSLRRRGIILEDATKPVDERYSLAPEWQAWADAQTGKA